MKLSEAIRKGIPLVRGAKGLCFRFEATGREWAGWEAHRQPLLGADALGTALVGIAGDASKAVEQAFEGPARSPLAVVRDLYPELWSKRARCPACKKGDAWGSGKPQALIGVVWHLQDRHNWSRKVIADYLEGKKL